MANTATTVTVVDEWHDSKRENVTGSISFSAGNYVTNGVSVTWTGQEFIKSATAPVFVNFWGIAGYVYVWDASHASIRIFQSAAASNPLSELTTAALPGGVTGDTIKFFAVFKMI